MSCEQLVWQIGVDDDASGVFSIDELLPDRPMEGSLGLEDLDEDDWFDVLEDMKSMAIELRSIAR